MSHQIRCLVGPARAQAGIPQGTLAARVGISRQALFLIESGRSVPSTALALKLAASLNTSVEALFALHQDGARSTAANAISAHWACGDADPAANRAGQTAVPVRGVLGRVERRLVAHPLHPTDLGAADVVQTTTSGSGRAHTQTQWIAGRGPVSGQSTRAPAAPARLFIAGCAPAIKLLCEHLAEADPPVRASWIHATTEAALAQLARKEVHVAGVHFVPPGVGGPVATRAIRASTVRCALTLASWQQGLVIRRGDRRAPRTIDQLRRAGLRVARREAGASANRLLDAHLAAAGLHPDELPTARARGHFGVAAAVALGAADVGVAAQHAALAHDLDFVPLDEERFDLVFARSFLKDPRHQRLGDVLTSRAFRADLASLGGYDTLSTGTAAPPISNRTDRTSRVSRIS